MHAGYVAETIGLAFVLLDIGDLIIAAMVFYKCYTYNSECPGGAKNPCHGNGICSEGFNGNGTCSCNSGWIEPDCKHGKSLKYINCVAICFGKPGSDPAVCSGAGTCVAPNNCSCDSGHMGEQCEIASCFGRSGSDPLVCNQHGYCVGPNKCLCFSNYTGEQCQYRK
jgi:hypothetical protein